VPERRTQRRFLLRRFTLGSGPLKRRSDRVEFLSRLLLVLALLVAAPLGLATGTAAAAGKRATAEAEALTRTEVQAVLLADAPVSERPLHQQVEAPAAWTGPHGAQHTGTVHAPSGAHAGTAVPIWVDRSGAVTGPPVTDAKVAGQGVVVGILTFLVTCVAAITAHLLVMWRLARRRARQWAAGWALVEPLWVMRFR